MKKFISIIFVIFLVFNSLCFASSEEAIVNTNETVETTEAEGLNTASNKILSNYSNKEQKIAEYTDKYGDKTYAYTAYYLELIRVYSIPVCIIGITIGAFNFYIIGEKKLDKKEKGFSFIMAFLCGLVFFQVIPLIFALIVAGK